MVRHIGSGGKWGRAVEIVGLVVLLVGTLFASSAAAQPAMSFQGADISETTVAVGENVTVSSTVLNAGSSGGGYTMEFEENGSDFATTRVVVPADDERTVTRTVGFDRPGRYRITVNDNLAGVVTVKQARARVATATEDRREIDIRAGGVADSESVAVDIPTANRSFALDRWSTRTGESAFNQTVSEYGTPSAAPVELPSADQSNLFGVVTVESTPSVEETTMRFAVEDALLESSSVPRDGVTVYQMNGSTWDRLPTGIEGRRNGTTVYEARGAGEWPYAVGRMSPDISVSTVGFENRSTETGQRLILSATVENTGPVAGEYVGEMRLNSERVNVTTVTVPAGDERTLSLTHEVTASGVYELKLNETSAGRIVFTGGDIAAEQRGGSGGETTPTQRSTPATTGTERPGASALPATVFGITTLSLVAGLGIALAVFVALLAVLRRSDDAGDSSDSFDQF